RIAGGQAERFSQPIAQILNRRSRIGREAVQHTLEGVAQVDQVGDALVDDGNLGLDEIEIGEGVVEEIREAGDRREDAVCAVEEQVGEILQVLRDAGKIRRQVG